MGYIILACIMALLCSECRYYYCKDVGKSTDGAVISCVVWGTALALWLLIWIIII